MPWEPGHRRNAKRQRRLLLAAATTATAAHAATGFVRPNLGSLGLSASKYLGRLTGVERAAASAVDPAKPPSLDYPPPPPSASLAWPRYLSWLAVTVAAAQTTQRKLFGGSEAVALDPSLPMAVRVELIKSRRALRSRADGVPRAFNRMLREAADTLEEVPALIVTVAVLAGDMLRERGGSLKPFRELGEAQALLFTAGSLHLGMEKSGNMRLLGGDFLYAEGQWMLAELGSLPTIRMISRMIRDFSDGCSEGGAGEEINSAGKLGAEGALQAAFLRTGTYFASVASGAAWIAGAPPETIERLRRYGADLGCAIRLAQFRKDLASQDLALWLARSASQALEGMDVGSAAAAVRGMRRLAHRVERSCAHSLGKLLKGSSASSAPRGLSFNDMMNLQTTLAAAYQQMPPMEEGEAVAELSGLGFKRNRASDQELQDLIAAGLGKEPLEGTPVPAKEWPEGGPKKALEGCMVCIGKELMKVNGLLLEAAFTKSAKSELVQTIVMKLFRSGGKRLRPALVLLVARALGAQESSLERVARLAVSIEVLHCASLVHDDLLDGADLRRGEKTTHLQHGDRAATLVGDYLFGTASCLVADLGSMPAVLLISKVIADFGRGELAQSAVRFEAIDYSLEDYLAKSFYKTASLLAAACQAAAALSGVAPCSPEAQACYRYGVFVGLAFQVVDDILDFTSTEEELGKPALADLKEGNLGAPVLFAAQKDQLSPSANKELLMLLDRRLSEDGDLDRVCALVDEAGGVRQAEALARRFVDLAAIELAALPAGEARDGLRTFAEFVVARSF